jgi:hypothetical protein
MFTAILAAVNHATSRKSMDPDPRAVLHSEISVFGHWYPFTFQLLGYGQGAFETFARAQSRSELANLLAILGIDDLEPLRNLINSFASGERRMLTVNDGWDRIDVSKFSTFDLLGSQP